MNKYLKASGIALILTGCSSEYATVQDALLTKSAEGDAPFFECFGSDYHEPVIVSEVAYQQADCFMSLAQSDKLLSQSIFNELKVGADQHTVLQYAYSWFAFSADQGYGLAKYSLEHNQTALYAFEDELIKMDRAKNQQFVYGKEFNALDTDQNGVLSFNEAQEDQILVQSFARADIDENGTLSLGEFIVSSGEATAAGFKHEKQSY